MGYPRAHVVDPLDAGFYHCTSRCVRRAWLCGRDALTGRSYDHRKVWLENRYVELAAIFAIDLYAYAVMSNHHHVVLYVDPRRVDSWSDEEVAARWLRLCTAKNDTDRNDRFEALLADKQRLEQLRARLGDLSWFMRSLHEPIARQANREDDCTGRFWEGRFHANALLDEGAVIAAMAYADMNPVRAGITKDIARSPHTSIARRLGEDGLDGKNHTLADLGTLGLTLPEYTALLTWTVALHLRVADPPQPHTVAVLRRLGHRPHRWLARVKALRHRYRAYGELSVLRHYVQSLGQQWIKGMYAMA